MNAAAPAPASPVLNDCWNRIGVRGDGSCPELIQHAHCRNCPVYAAAAISLLNRPAPANYANDLTRHLAELKKDEAATEHSAVIFRLRSEWFALSTVDIDEVAEKRRIQPLPHQRNDWLLGLANSRGELVICISLARMMGIDGNANTVPDHDSVQRERLIVIRHNTGRIAFPVDEVQRTLRFAAADLKDVPATIAKASSNYTRAILTWRDRIVGVIDEARVIQAVNRGVA
jgi:chemotaxis-related protein WspD